MARNNVFQVLVAVLAAGLLAGCGTTATEDATGTEAATEKVAEAENSIAKSTEYLSYEDVIADLSAGEGYAYVTLNGYDGDILATCSGTFEDEDVHFAIDANLYVKKADQVELLASIETGGTAYPITIDGGILYFTTPRQYAEADVTTDADGNYELNYYKSAAISYDEVGEISFEISGDIAADDITSEDDFYNLYAGSEGKAAVDFTVVE